MLLLNKTFMVKAFLERFLFFFTGENLKFKMKKILGFEVKYESEKHEGILKLEDKNSIPPLKIKTIFTCCNLHLKS